jgi:hypothetical protein
LLLRSPQKVVAEADVADERATKLVMQKHQELLEAVQYAKTAKQDR